MSATYHLASGISAVVLHFPGASVAQLSNWCLWRLVKLRHTLYLKLNRPLNRPFFRLSLRVDPHPLPAGAGHMLDLLDWPGPHPVLHTCSSPALY
ncbi:hypothetical protein R3I93_012787 [Phoxinus phoxinus]|uniref:Uncharacterized protein n=1 Tax=Phoxinus phoxinus TaxID=58324 RepID=A0AAN9H5F7_9TELE